MKKTYEKPDLEIVVFNTNETLSGASELSTMDYDNPFGIDELE